MEAELTPATSTDRPAHIHTCIKINVMFLRLKLDNIPFHKKHTKHKVIEKIMENFV